MLERYTNTYSYNTEQNKNHKTIGTVTMEICIKYKGETKEFTKYLAIQEQKM